MNFELARICQNEYPLIPRGTQFHWESKDSIFLEKPLAAFTAHKCTYLLLKYHSGVLLGDQETAQVLLE